MFQDQNSVIRQCSDFAVLAFILFFMSRFNLYFWAFTIFVHFTAFELYDRQCLKRIN